ncbi:MAG: aminodeoxychorismate synthase component I [Acidiferrobacterales bacterium]
MVQALDQFPDLAGLHRFRPRRYPHLLESAADGTEHARYDILFAFPGPTLSLAADQRVYRDGLPVDGDFLSNLEHQWRTESIAREQDFPEIPFRGGWFLYLGYELTRSIEPTLASLPTEPGFPVAFATRFHAAVVRDRAALKAYLVVEDGCAAADRIAAMSDDVRDCPPLPDRSIGVLAVREDDPELHLERIARTLGYIAAGDTFQVNLSRGWEVELQDEADPVDLYLRLRQANPAPFAGLASFGARQAVISSSPERLVCVRGNQIFTRPIAGTYPRGADPDKDRAMADALHRDPKERAEHVMLIDLERNDLGRICLPGTVRVDERMQVETYSHVHHLVSSVRGVLRAQTTPADVVRALFPGGTITGCPKVRTQKIIAELEQTARGPYTGSMGYLNRDGSMDLNILIRTLAQNGRRIRLRAGGGIVADSQPQRELRETRVKARGMLAAFGADALR